MQKTFHGYRRENGRVGVRNHVIVLPVDDLSNAAAEAVANNVKGVLAIRALAKDETVIKYSTDIGRAIAPIQVGEHAHVHNIKTKRW